LINLIKKLLCYYAPLELALAVQSCPAIYSHPSTEKVRRKDLVSSWNVPRANLGQ